MGCALCKGSGSSEIKNSQVKDPCNPNNFELWFLVFDFLEFKELLCVGCVSREFYLHSGNDQVLSKFTKPLSRQNTLGLSDSVKHCSVTPGNEGGSTPNFRTPSCSFEVRSEIKSVTRTRSYIESLDSIVPANMLKSLFLFSIEEQKDETKRESPKFQTSSDFLNTSGEDSEKGKELLWNSLKSSDDCALRELLIERPELKTLIHIGKLNYQFGSETVSPLSLAVSTCNKALVKRLLEVINPKDIDKGYEKCERKLGIQQSYQISPLQFACGRGLFLIAALLLCHGADPDLCGLHTESSVLIDYGPPCIIITCSEKYQYFSLKLPSMSYKISLKTMETDFYKTVKTLLENKANPNVQWNDPVLPTPLFHCLKAPRLISLLLEHGADPNSTNDHKQSPLYILAESHDNTQAASSLVEGGALIDPPTCRPLFAAISKRHCQLTSFLRDRGALVNGNGQVPGALQVAVATDNAPMCGLLLTWPELEIDWVYRQNGKNMFHRIAQNKGHQVFDLLIEQRGLGETSKIKDALCQSTYADPSNGDSIPLMFALDDIELSRKFIRCGTDLKRVSIGKVLTLGFSDMSFLEFLLNNGAPVGNGLWVAYDKGRIDLVVLFVRNGAAVDEHGPDGLTLLQYACLTGNTYNVKVLLKYRADPSLKSLGNKSARDYVRTLYPSKTRETQQKLLSSLVNK